MTVTGIEDIYPLSPMQEGMLSHLLTEPDSRAYFEQFSCKLSGALDSDALRQAWERVLERHAVLRTAFEWEEVDEPVQVVLSRVDLPLEHLDWCHQSAEQQAQSFEELLRRDRERSFHLDAPPLMRLILIRESTECHRLVWSHHHLLLDGWCRALLLQEVFQLYEALRHGRHLTLQTPRPYRDYIAWLRGRNWAASEAFWGRELADLRAATPVGGQVRRPSTAAQRQGEDYRTRTMSEAHSAALRALAQRHRVTLSTIVQGAWALLLGRYSDRRDVTFGTVVSGRPSELVGVESMIGLFINTVPLRCRFHWDQPASAWLRELQTRQEEISQHVYLPLSEIRKKSKVRAGSPLFESMIVFQNFPVDPSLREGLGSLQVSESRVFEMAEFPLTLAVEPEGGLGFWLGYDRGHFEPVAIRRMLCQLETLLLEFCTDAERRLREIGFLTSGERSQLLWQWNDTTVAGPPPRLFPERFKESVERRPQSPAVVWAKGTMSYRELDGRAERLATILLACGVSTESVVAVFCDRSPGMLVAILGVLKAGAAFLPLDPDDPAQRQKFLLDESRAVLLVTSPGAPVAFSRHGLQVVEVDASDSWSETRTAPVCSFDEAADHLAYVMYTSGSTGSPKGVGVSHRSLARFADEMAKRLELTASDRVLQFASPAFDVLVEELFPIWLRGGSVVLTAPRELASPQAFSQLLEAYQVSVVELPAVYWHEWMAELRTIDASPPACLRLLLLGTEKPSPLWLARWREFDIPLIQVFGLTETTVTTSLQRIEVGGGELPEAPIGRPIGGTRIFVLGAELEPVPLAVVGELFIGGEGVARGYLGQPGLTAQRFVPDLWSLDPGGRLYRTGDQVYYREDGSLEFLGRIDEQLKIRGFRIEPGEVEAALSLHPAVRHGVVSLWQGEGGHRRLIAHVVSRGEGVDGAGLRHHLRSHLPEYMVPSAFVELSELPVLPNGKIDRAALSRSVSDQAVYGADFLSPTREKKAPRSDLEALLCEIWGAVLGVPEVGIEDNYFELGGDSILSIQLASRARQRGLDLAPWQLFEHPSIAALAPLLERSEPIEPARIEAGGAVLTPIQHWFFEQTLAAPQHWNMPVLLRIRRELNPSLVATALSQVVAHHEGLRLFFESEEASWQARLADSVGQVSIPVVDLTALDEGRRKRAMSLGLGLVQASLHLGQAPLLRALWIEMSERERRLMLAAHHLVVDAVSWRVVAEDLELACWQQSRGEEITLPSATGFGLWSTRLAEVVRRGVVEEDLDFWHSLLERPSIRLPVDFEKHAAANTEGSSEEVMVEFSSAETETLLQQVPRAYRTQVNDALLTALGRAFSSGSQNVGILVELEGHGREELLAGLDSSRTVGWLASLYPVWLPTDEGEDLASALVAVKEALRAVPHRGMSFSLLRYLSEEGKRRLKPLPQAEVLFNYMGRVDSAEPGSTLYELASEDMGAAIDPRAVRSHLLEINARVADGRLQVTFLFSRNLYRRATIVGWAEKFARQLRELIAYCTTPGVGGFTPSDFPLAELDAVSLQSVVAAASREVEDMYPLSPLQQGMLFHSLYEAGDGVYVAQLQVTLRGDLIPQALRRAWQETVRRHAVLRTAFFWEELDVPVQTVLKEVEVPWHEEDWRALGRTEQESHLVSYLAGDRSRGFDMARAPLLRLALLRTGPEENELVVSLHQILLDGWSLPLLLEDVFTLYEGWVKKEDFGTQLVPRLPYGHYIAWLKKQDLAAAQAFWSQELEGYRQPAPLLFPPTDGSGYAERSLLLGEQTMAALNALARRHQVTLNTVVQGAWAILLSHYSRGRREVMFGAVVSGRPAELPGVESMLGLFINTLAVRVRVPAAGGLGPWLRKIQERQGEMRRYEYSSLAEVHLWSDIPPGEPLFESILVFQNYPVAEGLVTRRAGLTVSGARTFEQTNYALTLVVQPAAELKLAVAYPLERIDDVTACRLLEHLRTLLLALPTSDSSSPAEISWLRVEEKHQVLVAGNDTGPARGEGLTFLDFFQVWATRTPDTVAVVFESQRLTYGELDRRSETLAQVLRPLGVGPEALVALYFDRSVEMIVSLLAVFKAGAAYVPLDRRWPKAQLEWMLADCGVTSLLTRRHLVSEVSFDGVRTILVEDAGAPEEAGFEVAKLRQPLAANQSSGALGGIPPRGAHWGNLAYVVFTSGSTGRPKGVAVEHRQLAHYTQALLVALSPPAQTSWATISSLATDLGNTAIFPCLGAGGSLHVISEECMVDLDQASAVFLRQPVDCLKIVPSHLAALLCGEQGAAILPRRSLVLGGEAPSPVLVQQIRELAPGLAIFNHYGPTETTVGVTVHRLPATSDRTDAPLPAGRPLAGTQVFLLNPNLRPVGLGVVAEVYLGGGGVARGYVGRADETAWRFLPNPFAVQPGTRLYRTGDVARLGADGGLCLLGRADHQVQVRGHRVELREVEEKLGGVDGIEELTVIAQEEDLGGQRLVACCVVQGGAVTVEELAERARAALPPHLVPALFVVLKSLPRLPNGKVDRSSLAAIQPEYMTTEEGHVPPRSSLEERLVEIWRDLLKVERVGVTDHFFALGGHSLLATRLTSRIRREMRVGLPLRSIFEAPTVAAQAVAIAQLKASQVEVGEVERLLMEMEQS